MALTNAQNALIKAAIIADPVLNAHPANEDGAFAIKTELNKIAAPSFTVWKRNVSIEEIGDNFAGGELAGMTTGNQTRLQTIAAYSSAGVNPSLIDRRNFFDDVFSGAGGTITRGKLLILWKRLATRAEKILSTGTGTDATPATLGFEGELSYQDIIIARAS